MKVQTNKILFLISILSIVFILVGCTGNGSLKKYNSKMEKSMETVKVVETSIEMKDSSVLIYRYLKSETVQEDKLNVLTEISALDDSFTLNKKTSTETVDALVRSDLLPFLLESEVIGESDIEGDTLEFSISEDNFVKLYSLDEFNISGDAALVLNFENDKILRITCVFKTTSGKDVEINTEYSY